MTLRKDGTGPYRATVRPEWTGAREAIEVEAPTVQGLLSKCAEMVPDVGEDEAVVFQAAPFGIVMAKARVMWVESKGM